MKIPFFSSKKEGKFKDFLSAAYNVYNYRRDAVPPADADRMKTLIETVEDLYDDGKSDSREFLAAQKELEALMKKCGGTIYPLGFFADNTDVVVVAGILAIAIRSFFFQPFQIPTNSMYPTYHGMTAKVYSPADPQPSPAKKIWSLATQKASHYNLKAPSDGEVFIKVNRPENFSNGIFSNYSRPAKWLFIFPSTERVYTFSQNGKTFELALPEVFPIEQVMRQAYPMGEDKSSQSSFANALLRSDKLVSKNGELWFDMGKKKAGESVLSFDILGGDMLFVDRFTYNFRTPKAGEPFVFRTSMCEGITQQNGGIPDDKYYIKRIAGVGGDELKVENFALYRNGSPAAGAEAFKMNAGREGEYCGYRNEGAFSGGKSVKVPAHSYYALGDNSANSLDSRYWGRVPEKAVVGRPLVVFYPFTQRWGSAK